MIKLAGVSKSGYYGYLRQTESKLIKELKDEEDFEKIMKAYRFKGYNKGARGIKMTLENQYHIPTNGKSFKNKSCRP